MAAIVTNQLIQKIQINSEEEVFAIRGCDLKRWQGEISDLLNIPNFLSNTYYALFGIGSTAIFSLFPLYLAGASHWIISFYLLSAVFFILLGIIVAILDHNNFEQRKLKTGKINKDIGNIMNQLKK